MSKFERQRPDYIMFIRPAGDRNQKLASRDIKKAKHNNQDPVVYDVKVISRISGKPYETRGDRFEVYPSKWGWLRTYETPDGCTATFRSRSKVHHYAYEPDESILVARTSIGSAEGFRKTKKSSK